VMAISATNNHDSGSEISMSIPDTLSSGKFSLFEKQ
jgi:hypothetical protein